MAPRWHDLTGEWPWPMWRLDMDDTYARLKYEAQVLAQVKGTAN